jgi:outer membrane protein
MQAEAQFRIAEQDLVLRVAQAYFDVLIAQDSVQLAAAQKTAISEQLEQAKRNFDVGSATITDTLEAQARYDLTGAQQVAVQNDLEIKRRALQQLINAMPQDLKSLGREFKLEAPQPADMEKWVDDAQLNSLQLAIAQAGAEIAEKEVARNRGGHYPTVDLVANYSNNQSNGGSFGVGSDNTSKSVGVQLNLPLFQGGAVNSKWREAEANRERARQELENTRRSVALQPKLSRRSQQHRQSRHCNEPSPPAASGSEQAGPGSGRAPARCAECAATVIFNTPRSYGPSDYLMISCA